MSENTPDMRTPPGPDLRIVFEHTNGPLKGLREIMGTADRLKANPESPLPDHAERFTARGRAIDFASLIAVKRTYALYREIPRDSRGEFYPQRVR